MSPAQFLSSNSYPLIAITGPTGAGKSALALFLASKLRAEIVNCDSLQLYRHFDIGTAKVTPQERAVAPHHLIDVLDPSEICTAGGFARLARDTVREIAGRGNVPIVVGGTGFYLRAMLDGLVEVPQRDDSLRFRLTAREQRRPGALHRILRRLDPRAAARIHANDKNKLIRALEVCILTNRPLTDLYASGTNPIEGFHPVLIGLDPPRQELYEVLNQRCAKMWEAGLMDEVTHILSLGYSEQAKPFESLGYAQALRLLRGECTFFEALEEMRIETRRYAKRQWTWFKKDTRVSWIPGFGHSPQTQQNVLETIVTLCPAVIIFSS